MNEQFKEPKERIRRVDAILARRSSGDAWWWGASEDVRVAQALSSLHRAARRGRRSRAPTTELRLLLKRTEGFGRGVVRG